MQIVIDIDDYDYRQIKEYYEKNDTVEATYSYIYHGTPLPKGHGRLIDADALEPDYYGDWNGLCITEDKYTQRTIDDAPTIIEADKAESEDKE